MGIIITVPGMCRKPTLTLLKVSRKTSQENNISYSIIRKSPPK